jgi:uncharacterized protein YbcC (UPF0753/DUF2309 family)
MSDSARLSPSPTRGSSARLSSLRADVSIASRLVAPYWPLTSFVAVNPLGGLEHLPFDEACAEATRWFGASTHLSLQWYRDAHRRGEISEADLRRAIIGYDPVLASAPPVSVGAVTVDVVDLVYGDLVEGPSEDEIGLGGGPGVDATGPVDAYVADWCAVFVDEAGAPFAMPDRQDGLYRSWRALVGSDRRLRSLVGRAARRWISALPEDPLEALQAALDAMGVAEPDRIEALRRLVVRLPGWLGYARWCDEWAPAQHGGPKLRVMDLLATLATIDASLGGPWLRGVATSSAEVEAAARLVELRIDAALTRLGGDRSDAGQRRAVAAIIEQVPAQARQSIWLTAHEGKFRDQLLGMLPPGGAPSTSAEAPLAHVVHCIDVRSEVLRRHLEAVGNYDTYGFAGFFGVPVRWRPAGSAESDARCPVLVTPRHEVAEVSADPDKESAGVARGRVRRSAHDAYHDAKGSLGSPFALAESAGWLLGPIAAKRTLWPAIHGASGGAVRAEVGAATRVVVDADQHPTAGLPLQDRVLLAEAILSTISLEPTAPLVVLCGHGSHTVNNPHASALDCGACGGAPGGASARIAAAILNDPRVRSGLRERGRHLGEGTWVLAAEHDTSSDAVTVLDRDLVPAAFEPSVARLERDLAVAGARCAAERAKRLPGDPRRVRSRGLDWAQVRPEWGLAGNAAFVVGPRSTTSEVDLGGRVFLHSYDSTQDPDGVALETILTAPLVVAQWISSQYYFSTVDPEVFGAGDKMLHNPVGGIGVLRGLGGDLAVGLPRQSVMVGEQLAHQPLRLLAVVQAPLERIEDIIVRNSGLRDLVDNRWISLAARAHADEPWWIRSAPGTWETWHRATELEARHLLEVQ